ncbi:MAG: hypothetical protein HC856_08385, partial [Pseudanabaena sp. RU_4_16]|nr:hypothetical protein [Pseudanabaena sp. RU_4_16]
MVPLAVTSTRGWQRRLGARWLTLHKLVYPAAILGCWHYWWLIKRDIREPLQQQVIGSGLRIVATAEIRPGNRHDARDLVVVAGCRAPGRGCRQSAGCW